MIGRLRALTAFTAVVLRQASRDRSALFFMVVLPISIIIIIGTTFGGAQRLSVGLVVPADSTVGSQLRDRLEASADIKVVRYDSAEEMRAGVRRFSVAGGVVVPETIDRTLRDGRRSEIGLITLPTSDAAVTVRRVVTGIADEIGMPIAAASWVASVGGGDRPALVAEAEGLLTTAGPGVDVHSVTIGPTSSSGGSDFSSTAANNLVLFTFISSLTAATVLVNARKSGTLRRATATPAGLPVLLAGIALGWFVLALLQSVLIVAVGRLLFDVQWGATGPAVGLLVVFALVGCGAGLLVGALGSDEDRVGSLTPPIGIVLGALGGCMVPLEVLPPAMRTISRFVPQSWAVEAWHRLMVEDAGWSAIAPNLLVLAGFAVVLLAVSSVVMRRSLQRT